MNKTSNSSIFIWTGGALVIVIAVLIIVKMALPSSSSTNPNQAMGKIAGGITNADQVRGNKESKVVLVEYSDYACPACAANEVTVNKLVNDYRDKVAFVYRHFPLPYHIHSKEAAYATEAAARQGKFWDLGDLLFSKQSEWAESTDFPTLLSGYVKTIGLDEVKLKTDMQDSAIKAKVDADVASADAAGLNHTPTYYLNGAEIPNPDTYEEFKQILDNALKTAS
ncbi:MAG: thioredoxin domain-containing protein [bacterium]